MTDNEINNKILDLTKNLDEDNFIYDFLLNLGLPKSTISRLRDGNYDKSKKKDLILWPKKLSFLKIDSKKDVHYEIDNLKNDESILLQSPRFIIVTDFHVFLSIDLKFNKSLDIKFNELHKHLSFFSPLTGQEKIEIHNESEVDLKAARKMASLYDQIKKDNSNNKNIKNHDLNILFSRLLFCFYCEDAGIFKDNSFTNFIINNSKEDGSNTAYLLKIFFDYLAERNTSDFFDLSIFPIIKGNLFIEDVPIPTMTNSSKKIIIEMGSLDWISINPDIFGSMMQAVVNQKERQQLGSHYTSVSNIQKVIGPLFLEDLKEEFETSKNSVNKLKNLLKRIYSMSFFDPACGSGNFLIITFKELSLLELQIFQQIQFLDKNISFDFFPLINLDQFYGIEIDELSYELTIVSLWISKFQILNSYKSSNLNLKSLFPLKILKNIHNENAAYTNWEKICDFFDRQVIILGNPPFGGSKRQTTDQKKDISYVFKEYKDYKNLDYVCIWFYLAAKCLNKYSKTKVCFVSTNSISQGELVSLFWPKIYKYNLEIYFAYRSFIWSNNAKNKAGLSCVIISISQKSNNRKKLFFENEYNFVSNISPYLIEAKKIIIVNKKTTNPVNFPKMRMGNMPYDGGNLIFNTDEKNKLIEKFPKSEKFFKRLIGGDEFINSTNRWCLWIEDEDLDEINSIPPIIERISKVKIVRKKEPKLIERSHQFRERHMPSNYSLIVPKTTSFRRRYLPVGIIEKEFVISDSLFCIFDAPIYLFSILSSTMHRVWIENIGGRLQDNFRYSAQIIYNNFPFPDLNNNDKSLLEEISYQIIDEREKYLIGSSIADIYDPNKMPFTLKNLFTKNDEIIDNFYTTKKFTNDLSRLEILLENYDNFNLI